MAGMPLDGAAAAARKLVLVVDDSSDMRGLIADVLADGGYEVVTAASGGRALGLMAERLPDLVITDLMMPGMNGFSLRGEMLRRPEFASVPVIVLSAFWQRPSETLDVVDVIAKPLNIDRLLDAAARATSTHDDGSESREAVPAASSRRVPERRRDASRVQQEA